MLLIAQHSLSTLMHKAQTRALLLAPWVKTVNCNQ